MKRGKFPQHQNVFDASSVIAQACALGSMWDSEAGGPGV